MNILFANIIVFSALAGFIVSAYIYFKKKGKKKLVCPIRSSCDKVVHSKYSTMFGIPLEVMGMVYYLFIGLAYNVILLSGIDYSPFIKILTLFSLASVVMSLYLLSVQVFILKQWCAWCLTSSALSILIFIFSFLNVMSL